MPIVCNILPATKEPPKLQINSGEAPLISINPNIIRHIGAYSVKLLNTVMSQLHRYEKLFTFYRSPNDQLVFQLRNPKTPVILVLPRDD